MSPSTSARLLTPPCAARNVIFNGGGAHKMNQWAQVLCSLKARAFWGSLETYLSPPLAGHL